MKESKTQDMTGQLGRLSIQDQVPAEDQVISTAAAVAASVTASPAAALPPKARAPAQTEVEVATIDPVEHKDNYPPVCSLSVDQIDVRTTVFDPCDLDEQDLVVLVVKILEKAGCMEGCRIPEDKLMSLLNVVRTMHRSNPYHNWSHAFYVCLNTYRFLSGLIERKQIPVTTVLGILLGALCHDLDHCGVSNAILVRHHHPIALKYSNNSPLERHSLAQARSLLDMDHCNILVNCSEAQAEHIHSIMADVILSTDISDQAHVAKVRSHWKVLVESRKAEAEKIAAETSSPVVPLPVSSFDAPSLLTVLRMVLLCADIGIVQDEWVVFMRWVRRLCSENTNMDGRNNMTNFYEGQIRFLDSYARSLFASVAESDLVPGFEASYQRFLRNFDRMRSGNHIVHSTCVFEPREPCQSSSSSSSSSAAASPCAKSLKQCCDGACGTHFNVAQVCDDYDPRDVWTGKCKLMANERCVSLMGVTIPLAKSLASKPEPECQSKPDSVKDKKEEKEVEPSKDNIRKALRASPPSAKNKVQPDITATTSSSSNNNISVATRTRSSSTSGMPLPCKVSAPHVLSPGPSRLPLVRKPSLPSSSLCSGSTLPPSPDQVFPAVVFGSPAVHALSVLSSPSALHLNSHHNAPSPVPSPTGKGAPTSPSSLSITGVRAPFSQRRTPSPKAQQKAYAVTPSTSPLPRQPLACWQEEEGEGEELEDCVSDSNKTASKLDL